MKSTKMKTMTTDISDQIVKWLKEHPHYSRNALCELVGYDASNLDKAIKGIRSIPVKYQKAIVDDLKKYGFNYGNP